MKTLTCKELGGKCDQKISGDTCGEMVKAMSKHVVEQHPDIAKVWNKCTTKTHESGTKK